MNAVADKYAVSDVSKFEAVLSGIAKYWRDGLACDGVHSVVWVDSLNYNGKKDEIGVSIYANGTYWVSYRPYAQCGFDCKNNVTEANGTQGMNGPVPERILNQILSSGILECSVKRASQLRIR